MRLFVEIGTAKLLVPQEYAQVLVDIISKSTIVEFSSWRLEDGLKLSDIQRRSFQLVEDNILEKSNEEA